MLKALFLVALGLIAGMMLSRLLRGGGRDRRPLDRPPTIIDVTPRRAPLRLDPGLEAEVHSLLASGHKIEAVKRVREATGLGLAEAKDLVDALDQSNPR